MTNYLIILSFLGLGLFFPYDASQSTQNAEAPMGNGNEMEMVHTLVHEQLVKEIWQRAPFGDMDLNMMSRCPSGVQSNFISVPKYVGESWHDISEDNYYHGEIVRYRGCDGEFLCKYRVLAAESLIEVLANDEETYVGVDAWLDAHYPKQLDDMLPESVSVIEDKG